MGRTISSFIMAALMLISAGVLQARDFGLGAMIGEPTGINGKVWSRGDRAVAFGMAWDLENERDFNFHVDYLFHDFGAFNVTRGSLPLYYGIGGRLMDASDTHLGLRGVLGVNYLFARAPFDLFFEVAPVLDVVPETDMDVEGGVGMRFYFR